MAKKATTTKQAVPKPTYLKGTKSVNIPAHRVADVIAMIHKHGHGAKFNKQAKAAGVVMALHPKTVNFVKDFVAKNGMHGDAIGKQVINSDGSYSCT
jgi:hypothetical protein